MILAKGVSNPKDDDDDDDDDDEKRGIEEVNR